MSPMDHDADPFLTSMDDLVSQPRQEIPTIVPLSFGGLLDPPLRIQTDQTECGGKTWPAGMVLAEYLLGEKRHEMGGKTMFGRPTG